jgi:putative transcriptional regulator
MARSLVNLAIGLGMIWANVRHLATLDEMIRRIQLEAMAFALGIGVVVAQADLATALEVSRQTVNAIETGKYDPSLPLAFRMARLFGLSIEEIFFDGAAI